MVSECYWPCGKKFMTLTKSKPKYCGTKRKVSCSLHYSYLHILHNLMIHTQVSISLSCRRQIVWNHGTFWVSLLDSVCYSNVQMTPGCACDSFGACDWPLTVWLYNPDGGRSVDRRNVSRTRVCLRTKEHRSRVILIGGENLVSGPVNARAIPLPGSVIVIYSRQWPLRRPWTLIRARLQTGHLAILQVNLCSNTGLLQQLFCSLQTIFAWCLASSSERSACTYTKHELQICWQIAFVTDTRLYTQLWPYNAGGGNAKLQSYCNSVNTFHRANIRSIVTVLYSLQVSSVLCRGCANTKTIHLLSGLEAACFSWAYLSASSLYWVNKDHQWLSKSSTHFGQRLYYSIFSRRNNRPLWCPFHFDWIFFYIFIVGVVGA